MKPLDVLTLPLHGTQLVEASAGTGKTHAIATLFVRALCERRLEVGQLLVVTFSNAATFELRTRIRQRLQSAVAVCAGEHAAFAADAEMATLIARRGAAAADGAHLTAALRAFDEAAIFTIHGFCQRVLGEFAFESGVAFDSALLGDDSVLLADAVHDVWTRELYAAPAELVRRLADEHVTLATLARVAQLRRRHPSLRMLPSGDDAVDPVLAALRRLLGDGSRGALARLERRTRAAAVQSFDDLLQRLDAALSPPVGATLAARLRQRFPIAFIDEFQDTDAVQHRIVRRLAGDGDTALVLIGDPKQAIYSFRGADVGAYLQAKRTATAVHTLLTNRRSSRAYVGALNAMYGRARAPFLHADIPFLPSKAAPVTPEVLAGAAAGGAPLRVLFARRDHHPHDARRRLSQATQWVPGAVATALVRLLNGDTRIGARRIAAGDIAVLCRTNAQLRLMQDALAARAVPSVLQSDMSVFESAEAEQLERVLRAMAEPGNGGAIRAAITTPLFGVNGDELAQMRAAGGDFDRWVDRFQGWNDVWRSTGLMVALQHALDDAEVPARLLGLPGGERRLTNVLHLAELLHAAAAEQRRGPLGVVEWLQRQRRDPPVRGGPGGEAAQIRLESDAHAVTLATIHRSKGLQYDVVVCPFLALGPAHTPEETRRPCFHDSGDGSITLDLTHPPDPESRRALERETLAEGLRLLYVALTRARQLCLCVWGAFYRFERSPLAYLLHQPAHAAPEALVEATRARAASCSDDALLDDLDGLARAAAGAIAVELLAPAADELYRAAPGAAGPLAARTLSRPIAQQWRTSSFSALTAGRPGLDASAEEGIDRDQITSEAGLADAALAPPALPLHGFPRGPRPGILLHKVFEVIDFTDRDPDALRAAVARWTTAFRVGGEWIDAVCRSVGEVLDTPLIDGDAPLRLRDVPRRQRLDEMEFTFPVCLDADGRSAGLAPAALAEVFASAAAGTLAHRYAERVRQLPFRTVSGYLRGFIDCVLTDGERWYVVDYKSNDLGADASAYRQEALAGEMVRHDYVLQAHLYAVAVHRYLQWRLADYDYARHFGGVFYLFVRGMAPARGPATGVLFERPAPALVDRLSACLAGAEQRTR